MEEAARGPSGAGRHRGPRFGVAILLTVEGQRDQLERVESLIERRAEDAAASIALCRRVTSAAGSSFALGIRLTPTRCRDSMHAVYAWMRLADDAADAEAPREARAALLDRIDALTRQAFRGDARGSIWPAFARAVGAHKLEHAWFDALLEGVRADVRTVELQSEDDLERYCDRVAGNVGRCCVAIWGLREGVDPGRAHDLAGQRGRAFQRINIARDLDEDARVGRCYVPAVRLRRLGVGPTDAVVRADLVREAMDALESSEPLSGMVRRDAGPALWAMTRAYRLVARRLSERGAAASLGGPAKLGIAAGAFGRRVLAAGRLA